MRFPVLSETRQSYSRLMDQTSSEEDPEFGSPRDSPSEGETADRLDRLTASEAEAVIRRAIELTDNEDALEDYGSLDRHTLEIVANELGIPLKHLTRALAEQKMHSGLEADDSRFDRLMGITELDGAALVKGDGAAVQKTLATWFKSHEGLRAVRLSEESGEWERDTTPITAIRMGLGMSNSARVLRGVGEVHHQITSVGNDEHLVSIEAGKPRVRATARWLLASAVGLAILAGVAVALGPSGVGSGILAGVWTAVLFGAGAAFGVRSWSRRISRAIERTLDAVTDPKASGVFDRMPGRFGAFLESLGVLKK